MTEITTEQSISFFQGTDVASPECNTVEKVKQKIAELFNSKNVHFLLGSGASVIAIPSMSELYDIVSDDIKSKSQKNQLFDSISSDGNIEKLLSVLYSKRSYLAGLADKNQDEIDNIDTLIKAIQESIYNEINVDLSNNEKSTENLNIYKTFYQKVALRNRDLARVNIFTTNYDLLNEKALDQLNIDYNNGFSGGHEKIFNPARFKYTYSKRIDPNLEKFEPIENMVYLYKLHGSISWIEKQSNSFFNIQEVQTEGGVKIDKNKESHVLIYPTPLKQNYSLGAPYSDLIREFQTKLSYQNSVLFVIGYGFNDEHINNIVYQSLASNSSLSVFVFGKFEDKAIAKINDSRIYRLNGKDNGEEIHYFKYIVNSLLPISDENKDKQMIEVFINALSKLNTDPK